MSVGLFSYPKSARTPAEARAMICTHGVSVGMPVKMLECSNREHSVHDGRHSRAEYLLRLRTFALSSGRDRDRGMGLHMGGPGHLRTTF